MTIFALTPDNKLYKKRKNNWLLVSPNYNREDRRVSNEYINSIETKRLRGNKGYELLNNIWRDYNPVWEYNGKQYTSVNTGGSFRDVPRHFTDDTTYLGGFVLAMHNGKLKWAYVHSTYYPNIEIYDVNNRENPPETHTFELNEHGGIVKYTCHGGWTNIKNLKPIKCLIDNKFV